MKNKIEDLRNHLFATIEALLDDDNPMDIARARAVSDVAEKITNTAKVEVDFIRATGSRSGTRFIEDTRDKLAGIGHIGERNGNE